MSHRSVCSLASFQFATDFLRHRAVALALLLSALAAGPHTWRTAAPCALAIVGVTVIDGNGGAPLPDAIVLVRDGQFAAVAAGSEGPRQPVRLPSYASGPSRR